MIPKYTHLTSEQKAEVADICKRLVEISETARREGLLALDEMAEEILESVPTKNGRLLNALLRLVIDGTDESVVSGIADNFIDSSADNDFDILSFIVIKRGVLSLQRGDNPFIMQRIFLSIAGFDAEEEFCKATGFKSWKENY